MTGQVVAFQKPVTESIFAFASSVKTFVPPARSAPSAPTAIQSARTTL